MAGFHLSRDVRGTEQPITALVGYTTKVVLGMPTKAEEYRARAEEYERVADQLSFEPAKSVVLRIARTWRTMAEQAERDES